MGEYKRLDAVLQLVGGTNELIIGPSKKSTVASRAISVSGLASKISNNFRNHHLIFGNPSNFRVLYGAQNNFESIIQTLLRRFRTKEHESGNDFESWWLLFSNAIVPLAIKS
jgi:hypothetical protein